MPKPWIVEDHFYDHASRLRDYFTSRFDQPLVATPERFCWDFWNVPGQYRLLRTSAEGFFPPTLSRRFVNHLLSWGMENLGCALISPPWLSAYVEGCLQNFHGDLPHGPFAFVYSLTPWKERVFRGGETLLLKPKVLDYWPQVSHFNGLEEDQIIKKIPPAFNRLLVFDPRIPHAVQEVRGAQDLLESRLVIHGWFAPPRPFVRGPVTPYELQKKIQNLSPLLMEKVQNKNIRGAFIFRLRINASGQVVGVKTLQSTAMELEFRRSCQNNLERFIFPEVKKWAFHKKKTSSVATVPILFEE